jgi:superfamily I DNA/RNA helicase
MRGHDAGPPTGGQQWRHQFKTEELTALYDTQRAVTQWDGDTTVVVGGPGAAKSTTIGLLADRLTSEGDLAPSQCGILSFNRSVATETQQALQEELGVRGHEIDVQTAHAKALEVLRDVGPADRHGPSTVDIAKKTDRALAFQAALASTTDGEVDQQTVKNQLTTVEALQNAGATPEKVEDALGDSGVYDTVVGILDDTEQVAACILRPRAGTADELTRLQSRLRVVATRLQEALPEEWCWDQLDEQSLTESAWAYVALLGQTAAWSVEWLGANAATIETTAPTLAALPAYLLGDEDASTHLSGSIQEWQVSYHPMREARLFLDEVAATWSVLEPWRRYREELLARDLMDFETVLQEAARVLAEQPAVQDKVGLDRVMVDEAQDLSPQMLAFARRLADDRVILFGDPCQTINEWAGANRDSIDNLLTAGADEETLPVDFRKAPAIESVCDTYRATIDGETRLDMESHRAATAATEDDDSDADVSTPWPTHPVQWLPQGSDGDVAYEQVLDGLAGGNVPGLDDQRELEVTTLARTKSTVTASREVLENRGDAYANQGTVTARQGIDRVCTLLELLATLNGVTETTEYVGQHESDEGTKRPLEGPDALTAADAVQALPDLLDWYFNIPLAVSRPLFEPADTDPWRALVRFVVYDQAQGSVPPAHEPLFEEAYTTILTLAAHARRDRLPQLVRTLTDVLPLEDQFPDRMDIDETLKVAADAVRDASRDRPPRADPGAIKQLDGRWTAALTTDDGARHRVSTIHKFKGQESDVVIVRNLTPDVWNVNDIAGTAWQRTRGVSNLARVRHQLAFDESPAMESFVHRKAHNERRTAYTAISRARDLLVLIGEASDTPHRTCDAIDIDTCLPREVKRFDTTRPLDMWAELQAALSDVSATRWPVTEADDCASRTEDT